MFPERRNLRGKRIWIIIMTQHFFSRAEKFCFPKPVSYANISIKIWKLWGMKGPLNNTSAFYMSLHYLPHLFQKKWGIRAAFKGAKNDYFLTFSSSSNKQKTKPLQDPITVTNKPIFRQHLSQFREPVNRFQYLYPSYQLITIRIALKRKMNLREQEF